MSLIRSVPWTRQPQVPTGISSNQLADGLVFALNGAIWIDQVHMNRATVSGCTKLATNRGLATHFASANYLEFPHRDAYNVVGDISILWIGKFDNFTGVSGYNQIISKDNGGATNFPFESFIHDSNSEWGILRANASNYSQQNSSSKITTTGEWYSLFFADNGNPSDDGYGYINNIEQTWTNPSTIASSVTGNTYPIRLGRRQDNATQFNGDIIACFIWNRQISKNEYFSLYYNPWQLFAPLSRQIWMPGVASAVPTLSSSTYKPGTLTTDGWQPRVTAT